MVPSRTRVVDRLPHEPLSRTVRRVIAVCYRGATALGAGPHIRPLLYAPIWVNSWARAYVRMSRSRAIASGIMIDPASGVPAWRQLADALRARITAGEWPPGARLPSETHLGQEYSLGRTTVRRAVASLRAAGVVEVLHGWGMRVPPPREVEVVHAETGSRVSVRMPTPVERSTWALPDGVAMIVVTGPDGIPDAYPGDRTEIEIP